MINIPEDKLSNTTKNVFSNDILKNKFLTIIIIIIIHNIYIALNTMFLSAFRKKG